LPDVSWYDAAGRTVNWDTVDCTLTCVYGCAPPAAENAYYGQEPRHVMIMSHSGILPRDVVVPEAVRGITWRKLIDTSAAPPHDIYPDMDGPFLSAQGFVSVGDRSLVCFVSSSPHEDDWTPPADLSAKVVALGKKPL